MLNEKELFDTSHIIKKDTISSDNKGFLTYVISNNSDLFFKQFFTFTKYNQNINIQDIKEINKKDKFLFIDSLYIKESFQNKGIGSKLISDIDSISKVNKVSKVFLTTNTSEEKIDNLINFYNSNGFDVIKEINKTEYFMVKKYNFLGEKNECA